MSMSWEEMHRRILQGSGATAHSQITQQQMQMGLPSRDDPYDPDMTVQEALEKGLIAIIDSGTIANPRDYTPCGYGSPHPDYPGLTCTRNKGHAGVHAHVIRWDLSHKEYQRQQDLERKRKEADMAEREARWRDQQQRMRAVIQAADRAQDQIDKTMEVVFKAMQREESMVYGPTERKTRKFSDHNVGKVRKR